MKNNRKMKTVSLALVLLLVACVAMLAGCNSKEVSDIAISSSDAPRLTYVQGQELDLSTGVLTVMIGGKATSVPLSADGVSVTGYNKDQVGKQTLTISYMGKTTTMEVSVVARMTAENYETNYFVGDVFDASKGRVKIVNDDGSAFQINLDNPKMTVTGFDSSKAGTVTVKASYTNNDGAEYTATFDVAIYDVGEVTFTKPSKKAYQSHEAELNLTGGYFTVTAKGNSALTKYVNITPEMVTGFDPSAATVAHKNQPLSQMLTVSYAGQTFQYEISVLYGAVSQVKDAAEMLQDLDWNGTVTLTPEQGETAVAAIEAYLELSKSDRKLVSEEELAQVVRPAAQYLCELFAAEAAQYSDSFTLDENGSLLFVGETYEQLAIDTEKLMDEDEKFNVYASLLREMKETFADIKMTDDVTIASYIKVASQEEVEFCASVFSFLMRLHDVMNEIPDDWKVEDLAAYEEQINTAIYLIQANGLIGPSYSHIFKVLANWRTNDDYFDIIYAYYCYVAEDGESFLFEQLWQKLPLPGRLQDWYINFYNAVIEAQYMENYGNKDAYLRDTTNFMYYYFEALEISEEIKNGDNQFYKDIYAIIHGDAFMDENVTCVTGGYISHANGMILSDAFVNLWKQYLEVVRMYSDGTFDVTADRAKVEAVFAGLADLAPTEVYGFLASLKYLYAETNGSYLVLNYADNANNTLVYILANHYLEHLPEAARPMFQQVLLAMEYYAQYCAFEGRAKSLEGFKTAMESLAASYQALSEEDRTAFNDLLGDCYQKYQNIYQMVVSPKEYDIDADTLAKIELFENTINAIYDVSVYMGGQDISSQERQNTCILLYALYEKAELLYAELSASDNDDVRLLLHTKRYLTADAEETLETSFFKTRNLFVWYMFFGMRFEQTNAAGEQVALLTTWAVYNPTQLRAFLLQAADLLWASYNGTVSTLDKDYVASVMVAFTQMDTDSLTALYLIGVGRYFDSLQNYLHAAMAADQEACALATALLEAEFGYVVYEFYGHRDTEITYFKTQFEEAKALYEQLSDQAMYDAYLRAMYEHYLELYNSL